MARTITTDFVDVPALLRELQALPVFQDTPVSVRRVKLDVGNSRDRYVSGTASHYRRRLRIVIGQWVTAAAVAETLLHELVHLSMPVGVAHGVRFRLTLARAAREAWGIVVDPHPPPGTWSHGRDKCSAYVLDDAIEAALQPLIEAGVVRIPEPTRHDRAESLAKKRSADIEKRAAHALRMWTKAQQRLKRAKTIEEKWRKKNRYYERVAAKEGGRK